MDDIAQIAAEDAVVLVLTLEGKADLATLSQTVEIAPVVPAAQAKQISPPFRRQSKSPR